MSIKLNWKTGLILVAVVGLACSVSYQIGQPEYCCAYPENRDFIDYLAALSGPIGGFFAVGIAIGIEVNRRRQEEYALDEFRTKFNLAFYLELSSLISKAAYCFKRIKDGTPVLELITELPTQKRSIYEALLPNIHKMQPKLVYAVATFESRLDKNLALINGYAERGDKGKEKLLAQLVLLVRNIAIYQHCIDNGGGVDVSFEHIRSMIPNTDDYDELVTCLRQLHQTH